MADKAVDEFVAMMEAMLEVDKEDYTDDPCDFNANSLERQKEIVESVEFQALKGKSK